MTSELVGRDAELGLTVEFARSLADGGASLVLAGGAGIGKTALWRAAIARASGELRVLQTRCAEVEMPIAVGAGTGSVVELAADGTANVVASGLNFPNGIAVAKDGSLYVTTESICTATGTPLSFCAKGGGLVHITQG